MRTDRLPFFLCIVSATLSGAAQTVAKPPTQEASIHCFVHPVGEVSDADRALVGGDPARAEGLYATRLTGPAALAASAGLVKSQMEQNKLAEALSSAHAAAGAMSSSAEAQVLVGDVLLRSGHIPEASAAFSAALSLDPCSPRAQFGVGRIADLTSHHASAARKFALAHKLAPNDAEITAALAMTMPETQRAVLLRDLLASTPLLPPGECGASSRATRHRGSAHFLHAEPGVPERKT